MTEKIPAQAQQLLIQLQQLQQQLQQLAQQKQIMEIQKLELDKALEELEKTQSKEEVYKMVGPILVKTEKAKLEKDLSDKKESIEVRIKRLDSQMDKMQEKAKETQMSLQKILEGGSVPRAG